VEKATAKRPEKAFPLFSFLSEWYGIDAEITALGEKMSCEIAQPSRE